MPPASEVQAYAVAHNNAVKSSALKKGRASVHLRQMAFLGHTADLVSLARWARLWAVGLLLSLRTLRMPLFTSCVLVGVRSSFVNGGTARGLIRLDPSSEVLHAKLALLDQKNGHEVAVATRGMLTRQYRCRAIARPTSCLDCGSKVVPPLAHIFWHCSSYSDLHRLPKPRCLLARRLDGVPACFCRLLGSF